MQRGYGPAVMGRIGDGAFSPGSRAQDGSVQQQTHYLL